jgi:Double zinc ribbon
MDALLGQFGQAIGDFFGQPTVRLVLLVAAGYLVMVWLATALWAFVDMRRRTANPIWSYAFAAAVVVASPLLFPFAVLLHVIVRPRSTVADRRISALRDAALDAEVERPICPVCRHLTDEDWLICPYCRTALGHLCDHCGHAVGIDWDACAWCGALFGPPAGVVRAER